RFVAFALWCWRDAVVEERVRGLLSPPRAADDHAIELRPHEQMADVLAGGNRHARTPEQLRELGARQLLPIPQRALQHGVAAPDDDAIEPELSVMVAHRHPDARRGQPEHPACVLA